MEPVQSHSENETKGTVMIVDDSPGNLRVLESMLTNSGYRVRPATSGPMALKAAQTLVPDLILLDILMPDMDGYAVCRALKTHPFTRSIPVIFISALDEVFDKLNGFRAGGVDYITKPFQAEEVLARVDTHLTLRKAQSQLEERNLQLQETNARLEHEIAERQRAEAALQRSHDELETRVRERTAELAEAKEVAEVANLAKNNFLSSVSHELRTPLNTILGFAQLLEAQIPGPLNAKQEEQVRRILTGGHQLLALIKDVLDLSQVDLGKLCLNRKEVRIKHLLESSVLAIRERDLRDDLILTVALSPECQPLEIMADEVRLKQVMFNLLTNAVKFTPGPGTIVVAANVRDKQCVISVTDSGIGIAAEELERIFENFYQVKGGLVDKTRGVGLGLPIAKRLIELHGGRIWVESAGAEQGSCISFTLPLER